MAVQSFSMAESRDPLTYAIIGAAMAVQDEVGPGLLESAYEAFLCIELVERGLAVRRQVGLPAVYKGHKVDLGFRPDLIVDDQVIVELKCVDKLIPVHEAQILTYMKLAGLGKGLLLNFQSRPLINGLKRFVL